MGYDDESRVTALAVQRTGAAPAQLRNDIVVYDARGKVLSAGPERFTYAPLGAVVHSVTGQVDGVSEDFTADALGRMLTHHMVWAGGNSNQMLRYGGGTSHVDTTVTANQVQPDSSSYAYDAWGTLTSVNARHNIGNTFLLRPRARSYYGSIRHGGGSTGLGPHDDAEEMQPAVNTWLRTNSLNAYDGFGMLYRTRQARDTVGPGYQYYVYTTLEKHHYDALGRRVWSGMLRGTTTTGSCPTHDANSGCENAVTRYMWDGDQLLLEDHVQIAQYDTLFRSEYGTQQIQYVHGGGIDQPLALLDGTQVFANARGFLDIFDCPNPNSCPYPDGVTAYGDLAPSDWGAQAWHGTLLAGGRTGSGQLYRRNRYVDPATGSFTQADPAGLAGGLNAYGFAGGDPVSYSDPFGLRACPPDCAEGQELMEAAQKRVDELWTKAGGKAAEIVGSLLAATGRGIVKGTTLSVDVNAGPVTTSFSPDATSVDLSSGIGLNLVATATFMSPKAGTSGPNVSVGQLFGAGVVGGGSLKLGTDGVRGGSASVGIGIQLPAATKLLMKTLSWGSVTVGEQKR